MPIYPKALRPVLTSLIRDVPDFPEPGVVFKDITPLLGSPEAFALVIGSMAAAFDGRVDKVAALEARGFLFAAPIAITLGVGLIPIRKPGKLPYDVLEEAYNLEYGSDAIEMHADALIEGERVLLVDDVIATGGTLAAAIRLIDRAGGEVVAATALLEVPGLGGRARLGDIPSYVLGDVLNHPA
jgi:adenine phosphoribosyltransferase